MPETRKQFTLRFWNSEKNMMEDRTFSTSDIDWMIEKEMIDNDCLGYAMDDKDAFERALLYMTESNRSWKYSEFVELYLGMTDRPLVIEA